MKEKSKEHSLKEMKLIMTCLTQYCVSNWEPIGLP